MSSGASHARTSALVLGSISVVGITAVFVEPIDTKPIVYLALGAFLGLIVTPDIDIDSITHEERRLMNLFGPLGRLWHWYWLPYALFFRHSRLKHNKRALRDWSHRHILGTATRLLYLLWLPLLVIVPLMEPGDPALLGWLFLGWATQDTIHIMQDKVHTRLVKFGAKPRRRQPAYTDDI